MPKGCPRCSALEIWEWDRGKQSYILYYKHNSEQFIDKAHRK